MRVEFFKYSGCGNDFILIDDRNLIFPSNDFSYIQQLCHRTQGVGADGLLLLQHSSVADYKMRIFNADGKEAGMCGNGLRCLVDYVSILENQNKIYRIEAGSKIYLCQKRGEKVWIEFGNINVLGWDINLSEEFPSISHIDSGVPHALLEVSDLDALDIDSIGKKLRFHPYFGGEGANANFIYISSENRVHIRTYERGVEGETLACGTGATAAAILVHKKYQLPNPIKISVRSGDILEFHTTTEEGKEKKVEMLGSVTKIFQGIILLPTEESLKS